MDSSTSPTTCRKCAGFVVTTKEGTRCINCGRVGVIARPTKSTGAKVPLEKLGFNTYTRCTLDKKHGRVAVKTCIDKTYMISLSGHRDAFDEWLKHNRATIENWLYVLLHDCSRAGSRRKEGLQLSAPSQTVALLKKLDPVRIKNLLGNMFAFPFSQGYLRNNAPRGTSANQSRILFWQTARDISGPLQSWMNGRRTVDAVYAQLQHVIRRKCRRVTDGLILRYLIDLNWVNAGRAFPDKPALVNRQTYRYLKSKTDAHPQGEYTHSRGWDMSAPVGDQLSAAIGHAHRGPTMPLSEAGMLLAREILNGHYIVRSRSFKNVSLDPGL